MWGKLSVRLIEGYLVARLLSSPTFHRFVARVQSRVANGGRASSHEITTGGSKDPDAEARGLRKFVELYKEELKNSELGQKFKNKN